jgi:DNA-binding NarL/FixJ family response regulator
MRLVLADDSLLVREGLSRLLEHLGHQVLEQTGSPDRLLACVAHHRPHAVVVDIKCRPRTPTKDFASPLWFADSIATPAFSSSRST